MYCIFQQNSVLYPFSLSPRTDQYRRLFFQPMGDLFPGYRDGDSWLLRPGAGGASRPGLPWLQQCIPEGQLQRFCIPSQGQDGQLQCKLTTGKFSSLRNFRGWPFLTEIKHAKYFYTYSCMCACGRWRWKLDYANNSTGENIPIYRVHVLRCFNDYTKSC